MINEITYQLQSKEVTQQYCPVQLSQTDANKILELLKEQEPRVLTPDEIISHEGYVWQEYKSMDVMTVVEIRKGMELVPYELPYPTKDLNWSNYQKEWRCWTVKPTDEQRKAVKWDDWPG